MSSAAWRSLFGGKASPSFPWSDDYRLTAGERELVTASLQQFQLGEGSEGNGLKERARCSALATGDPDFLPALDLFIREEQRHSSDLGRFLDREGIARMKHHWVDRAHMALARSPCEIILSCAHLFSLPEHVY